MLAWLAGGTLAAVRFDFAFPPPAHAVGYGKVFPALRHFECARTAVWFDSARLHDPVRRDEAALRAFIADAQHQVIVPKRGDELLNGRVRGSMPARCRWRHWRPSSASTSDGSNGSSATARRGAGSRSTGTDASSPTG